MSTAIDGTYKILDVLGSGGMGTVYLAEHGLTERQVAIKVMHEQLSGDQDRVRRFQAEARALSRLNHPAIVQTPKHRLKRPSMC